MNEDKFHCGHNMHILCVMKSNLKNKCALCYQDISNECLLHFQSCKKSKCICKETEMYNNFICHKIITDEINKNKNLDVNSIKKILLKNKIKNYDEILKIYFK